MKKLMILLLILSFSLTVAACSKNDSAASDQKATQAQTGQASEAAKATDSPSIAQVEATKATADPTQSETQETSQKRSSFDPYATANEYSLSSSWFKRQDGTDYGTLLTDVAYFSTTADDYKRVNILLPPDYDADSAYPVLYMIHGWGGDYTAHLYEDSYLHMLYGNMFREGIAESMIIVGVDMYTASRASRKSSTAMDSERLMTRQWMISLLISCRS